MIHARFEGRSYDLNPLVLPLGSTLSDQEVNTCIAAHVEAPANRFHTYVLERPASRDGIVHPEAVYGSS
ncbi:MAG: hypothetical protein AAGI71_18725 [Bacteroidota bacterium]